MEITETNGYKGFGEKGYLNINDDDYAIIKEIDDNRYIVVDNICLVYFVDLKEKIFELIWE